MGGEAAKERRRLKRLQAQPGSDAPTVASPSTAGSKSGSAPGAHAKSTSTSEKSPAPSRSYSQERKPVLNKNPRSRPFRQDDTVKHNTFRTKGPFRQDSTAKHNTFQGKRSFRQGDTGKNKKFQVKKVNKSKVKKPKPKHLKRKMELLAKSMVDGSANVAEVEGQMKEMMAQVEQYKRSKQNTGASKADVHTGNTNTEEDAVTGGKKVGEETDKRLKQKNDVSKEDAETGNDDTNENDVVVDDAVKGEKEVQANEKGGEESDKRLKQNKHGESKEDVKMGNDNTEEDEVVVDDVVKGGKEVHADEKEGEASSDEELSKSSASSSSSSSSNSSDDDSDDDDEIADSPQARSRGKRGKGRKDNKPKIADGTTASEAECEPPKKEDKRRCIGRKPVTDFNLGEKHQGTVRYIKPKLGAFIDIGCHSDAFCHISCISDHFAASVADVLKVDDVVENVRVVEIDKAKKRITVSLRSEEMAENEQKRLKTTRRYEKGLRWNSGSSGSNVATENSSLKSSRVGGLDSEVSGRSGSATTNNGDGPTIPTVTRSNADEIRHVQRVERPVRSFQKEDDWVGSGRQSTVSSHGKDLKRERKLERRAQRRAAMEAAG